jgi:hypothetical protein
VISGWIKNDRAHQSASPQEDLLLRTVDGIFDFFKDVLLRVPERSSGVLFMQRVLIIIGIAAIIVGLLWPWLGKIPLGRLPGDIVVERPNLKIYIPLTSMILVSVLISVLLWIFRK